MDKPPAPSLFVLALSPRSFALLWSVTLLMRGVCCVFLCASGALYIMMSTADMEYYAKMLTADPTSLFMTAAILFLLLGCAHGYRFVLMVFKSLQHHQLVFDDGLSPTMTSSRKMETVTQSRLWHTLFDRRGFFGIESGYFDVRFVVREAIEIVSQTSQAYSSSLLIGTSWINELYVAFIVINCWSTPLVQRLTHRRPPLERLACLLTDAFLDASTSMLLPFILILPYWRTFDPLLHSFELTLVYDDVWYMNLVNENRQIFARDWIDLILKLIPHCSIFSCVSSIKGLVARAPPPSPSMVLTATGPDKTSVSAVVRPHKPTETKKTTVEDPTLPLAQRRLRGWIAQVIHMAFFLWGIGVLALHVIAMRVSWSMEDIGCKQVLRPWFASQYSCLVYEFNCYRQEKESIEPHDLDVLANEPLGLLLLTHCPALVVPQDIQRFHNLLGMEIYNCTIRSWPPEHGITQSTHPVISYVFFARTNMSAIPEGILYDLPSTLIDIELSVANLTTFPDDLDRRWSQLYSLYVEHSGLKQVPEVVWRMAIPELSLIGNQIESLPSIQASWYSLALSQNPLRQLPASNSASLDLRYLSIENTQIAHLPDWIKTTEVKGVFASHTPFCANQSADDVALNYGDNGVVTCIRRDERGAGRYPLAHMTALRQP